MIIKALLIFFLLSNCYASNCFTVHLKEAINLNKARMASYSLLSDSKSIPISKKLIILEQLTLPLAKLLDFNSRYFFKNDIKIFCDDFVSMKNVAPMQSSATRLDLKYREIEEVNIKLIYERIKFLVLKEKFTLLTSYTDLVVQELEETPHFNCMTKHILESIRRSSYLTPGYLEQAYIKNLKCPLFLLKANLLIQAKSLFLGLNLDQQASGLQEEGVAILCNDLPHIPMIAQ